MMLYLNLPVRQGSEIRSISVKRTSVLGRSQECGLRIDSPAVSRRHCELRITEGAATVVDLGSANGTFVDDLRLKTGESHELPEGCRLNVGGVHFRVSYASPAVAGTPASGTGSASESEAGSQAVAALPEDRIKGLTAASAPVLEVEGGRQAANDSVFDEPLLDDSILAEESGIAVSVDRSHFERAAAPEGESDRPAESSADALPTLELDDEPDLMAMFADDPIESPSGAAKSEAADDDFLPDDEDEAFAFLNDDSDVATGRKPAK